MMFIFLNAVMTDAAGNHGGNLKSQILLKVQSLFFFKS